MKQLIFALILVTSVINVVSAQVKLVQIEPSAQKFKIPVAKKVINGKYYMEYETMANLLDSLGINIGVDSIYMANDTIKLRDGSGFVVIHPSADSTSVLAGYGITVTETPINTYTVKADTSKLVTQYDLSSKVDGSGVATRVAFWNGSNSLSSSANLYWQDEKLNIKGINYTSYAPHQIAIGSFAGFGATNAQASAFLGQETGLYATNASGSNFFGNFAGQNATNAESSNFFGANSGLSAFGAHSSNFFGVNSGANASSAYRSNFFGAQSGMSATNASFSNFFGFQAGQNATNAGSSNFFGTQAGYGATNANYSNFFGAQAGMSATNAGFSNFFGYDTGSAGIGSNNIIIGKSITLADGTTNSLNIGGVIFGTGFNNGEKTANAVNGKIGINKVSPTTTLHVGGDLTIDTRVGTAATLAAYDSSGKLCTPTIGSGLSLVGGVLSSAGGGSGATQYLNAYIDNSDTLGFYLTVAQDTVVFRGVDNVSGEATTVGDTPTIDMTLTGTTITASVVDGSITPAKLSQSYLTSEVDGSVSNELQTLSINNNQLSITGGNTVTLPSGGSTEWASLDYGTQAANTQSFTSSVWNTINFLGSNESNSAIINANHTNDDIEFVVAGNYKIDYAVSFVANADALIYMGLHSSVTNDVPFKTQIEGDTDVGYKTCQMSKSIIYSATAGEKLKLQIQPLTAHTSVGVYAHFIITKL